ncbi:MAG: phenylalanine--tRNA ligase subunit beta [Candidatus Pacebacteria bacterium]|nr:phenylalanine--tRNA ligase subunit beta [Candidatus Paceibacterota bacterium]
MKISYNWLKWYIPEVPEADKLRDIFTYHLCEVEGIEKLPDGDTVFDINILPNRAHDLLSVHGIARELASQLGIEYKDPSALYKVPEAKPTNLEIKVESENCRRYMGRIVRNVKVGPSPEWVVNHLASIGQRSINNIVDASNITMYDSGQPTHCFDLDKINGAIVIRQAKEGESITTLDNKEVKLTPNDMVIADEKNVLAIAGVKGGKIAEVDENTKNIIIEVANFAPVSVRKTRRAVNIFTDAVKRFENDLSPELCEFAMKEISGLMIEYGFTDFEDVVDIYPNPQKERQLTISPSFIANKLGREVSEGEVEDILKRYNFKYEKNGGEFTITPPALRLDLEIPEDMVEEIGRVAGYDKVTGVIPKINFTPKVNETYEMIQKSRAYLLSQGYNEVMTYTFANKGKVEVLASASDKKFLRTNLSDGLKESLALNKVNAPLLGENDIKVFEIGTVWNPTEEMHVAYGNKKEIKEMSLEQYVSENPSLKEYGYSSAEEFLVLAPSRSQASLKEDSLTKFKMWSLFPFIARDIALWAPVDTDVENIKNIIKENMGDLVVKGPDLFDQFKKEDKISYGFRLIFQSYDRTLTDAEVGVFMQKITEELTKKGFEIR